MEASIPSSLQTKDHILFSRKPTDRLATAIVVGLVVAFAVVAGNRSPVLLPNRDGVLCKGATPFVFWSAADDGGPPVINGATCMRHCPTQHDVQSDVRVKSPDGIQVLVYPTIPVVDSICLPTSFSFSQTVAKATGFSTFHLHIARFVFSLVRVSPLAVFSVAATVAFVLAILGAAPSTARFAGRLTSVGAPFLLVFYAWLSLRLAGPDFSTLFRFVLRCSSLAAVYCAFSHVQRIFSSNTVDYLDQAQVASEVAIDCLLSMPALLASQVVFVLVCVVLSLVGISTAVCVSFARGVGSGCLVLLNTWFLVELTLALQRFVTAHGVCVWYFTLPDYHGLRETVGEWHQQPTSNSLFSKFVLSKIKCAPASFGIAAALRYHIGSMACIALTSICIRLFRFVGVGIQLIASILNFFLARIIPCFPYLVSPIQLFVLSIFEFLNFNIIWTHMEIPSICELVIFSDDFFSDFQTAKRRVSATEADEALASLSQLVSPVPSAVSAVVACASLLIIATFRRFVDSTNDWFVESVGAGVVVFSFSAILTASVIASSFHLTSCCAFYCLLVELQPNLQPLAAHLVPPPMVFAPDAMRTYWETTQISRKLEPPGLALSTWRPPPGDTPNEVPSWMPNELGIVLLDPFQTGA